MRGIRNEETKFGRRGKGMVPEQASAPRGRGQAALELNNQPRNKSVPTRRHATKVYTSKALVVPLRAMAPTAPNSSDNIEDSQPLVLPPGPTVDIMAQRTPATPHSSDEETLVDVEIVAILRRPAVNAHSSSMSVCPPESSNDIAEATTQSSEVKATASFKGPHEGGRR